ncbi:hypothetical protein ACFL0X_03050, partial [Nanoarchaeota archaeon]
VTGGGRDDWIDKEVKSIINLEIPKFEIIVCGGKYKGKYKDKVKYVSFDHKLAWITKKKNLICENAKYENLIITHDRFIFDKNWYQGIKKYGNYFEVLSCIIRDIRGRRADDWVAFERDKDGVYGTPGHLDYRDWDKNSYVDGGLYILKKSVWERCKWDESFEGDSTEDAQMSKDFEQNGFIIRFNPFSSCKTLKERGNWSKFKFNKHRFILPQDRPLKTRIKNWIKKNSIRYIVRGRILDDQLRIKI